jgi:hypothetical protein
MFKTKMKHVPGLNKKIINIFFVFISKINYIKLKFLNIKEKF